MGAASLTALSPRPEHPNFLQARPAEACRVASHDGDDSAIVTTLPEEEQLMPLSRLNEGFEIELEGIAFGMVDRQGHRWRCLITDRVLSDAIGGAPMQKDKTAWFRANRSSLERVASNKFDMGAFEKDGCHSGRQPFAAGSSVYVRTKPAGRNGGFVGVTRNKRGIGVGLT